MNKENNKLSGHDIFVLLSILTVVAVILALAILPPMMEASTFNKFKSQNQPEATFWDAVFSELRVETTK